jgi:hypothetical protein
MFMEVCKGGKVRINEIFSKELVKTLIRFDTVEKRVHNLVSLQ